MPSDQGPSSAPPFDAHAFERLLDQVPAPMYLAALDGRALWLNRAWLAFTGVTHDAAVASPWTAFVHPDDLAPVAARCGAAIERREPFEVATRIRRHDGQWRWTLNRGAPYRDVSGDVVAYVGTLTDVTEQRLAQERMRQVLDHLGGAAFLHTPGGRYLFVNREWHRLFNPGGLDVAGRPGTDFFPEPIVEEIKRTSVVALEHGGRVQYEITLPTIEGPRRFLIVKFPLHDPVGGVEAICGIATDLTEVRERDAHARALERRMDEARHLSSIAVLAGGVAHDFNNLLQEILGNASLLALGIPDGARGREHVDQIVRASTRAAELTGKLLDYAGLSFIGYESVDPRKLLTEWEQDARAELPRHVKLLVQCEAGLPPMQGDEARLRQVLTTFSTNAVEAIGERPGSIAVRASLRGTGAPPRAPEGRTPLPAADYVCIEVRDDGEGMDRERVERVFDPFFSTRFPGRGLGLAAALGIAHAHAGTIEVESAPGEGAAFRLLVPAAQPSRSDSRNAEP